MPSYFGISKDFHRIPSVDAAFQLLGTSHPCLLLNFFVGIGFFVFGLGALETSTLLPIPIYGCWNAVQLAAFTGPQVCKNVALLAPSKPQPDDMLWSCGSYAWWQPDKWGGGLLVAGRVLICIAAGVGADVFGRRRSAIVWMGAHFVFSFGRSFSPLVEVYVVCVTMEAICVQATTISLLLIVTEGSLQKECVRSACLVLIGHSLGVAIGIPLASYLIPRETFQQIARSVPLILFVLYLCFLPESTRWLITQNRLEDVPKTLRMTNRVSLNENVKIEIAEVNDEITKSLKSCKSKGGLLKQAICPLLFSKVLLRIHLPCILIGFLIGAALNFRLYQDSLPYHSTEDRAIVSGVTELLALQLLGLILARLPVRRVLASLTTLFAIIIILTRSLKQFYYESCIGEVFFSNVGHFVAVLTWVWFVIGVIRLTPTHSRGTMLGITLGFATLGHALSRLINYSLVRNVYVTNYMVAGLFACFSLASGFITALLHQTPIVLPDFIHHLGVATRHDKDTDTPQEEEPLKQEIDGAEDTRL